MKQNFKSTTIIIEALKIDPYMVHKGNTHNFQLANKHFQMKYLFT